MSRHVCFTGMPQHIYCHVTLLPSPSRKKRLRSESEGLSSAPSPLVCAPELHVFASRTVVCERHGRMVTSPIVSAD